VESYTYDAVGNRKTLNSTIPSLANASTANASLHLRARDYNMLKTGDRGN
jgi:hypothetical protein